MHAHSHDEVGRRRRRAVRPGRAPTGVRATDDVDALLALDADCVCYMAQGETRIRETIDDLCRILASGKNVVNTSIVSLVLPGRSQPKLRDALEKACEEGGTTFFTSGFDPGWSGDVIPLALASACERVDSIRVTGADGLLDLRRPRLHGRVLRLRAPARLRRAAAPARACSRAAGAAWCCCSPTRSASAARRDPRGARAAARARDASRRAMGKIEKGTCAGVRFEVQGIVDGKPALVAAHVNRLRDDIGPDWDRLSGERAVRLQDRGEGLAVASSARSSRSARTATTTPPASSAPRCAS